MEPGVLLNLANLIAALLTLAPLLRAALFADRMTGWLRSLPLSVQLAGPSAFGLPWVLAAGSGGTFGWGWFGLYAASGDCRWSVLAGQLRRREKGCFKELRRFEAHAVQRTANEAAYLQIELSSAC